MERIWADGNQPVRIIWKKVPSQKGPGGFHLEKEYSILFHVPEQFRITGGAGPWNSTAADGNNGAFFIPGPCCRNLKVIASDGSHWAEAGYSAPPWEHVSVSLPNRTPNWAEMSFIKGLFWNKEDCIIQFHPPESKYVNFHDYCLHLWRPVGIEIPMPPLECV